MKFYTYICSNKCVCSKLKNVIQLFFDLYFVKIKVKFESLMSKAVILEFSMVM